MIRKMETIIGTEINTDSLKRLLSLVGINTSELATKNEVLFYKITERLVISAYLEKYKIDLTNKPYKIEEIIGLCVFLFINEFNSQKELSENTLTQDGNNNGDEADATSNNYNEETQHSFNINTKLLDKELEDFFESLFFIDEGSATKDTIEENKRLKEENISLIRRLDELENMKLDSYFEEGCEGVDAGVLRDLERQIVHLKSRCDYEHNIILRAWYKLASEFIKKKM